MFEQSATITKLAGSLAKAQASIEGAVKGKVNPAFRSKYADLASVWDACREQLTGNGLAVVQLPGEMIDGRMTMTTQLTHESGEWLRSTLSMPLAKVDPQGFGSAVTYARRYALAALVGVCPEDDDGNAATKAHNDSAPAKPATTRQPPEKLTGKHKTRAAARTAYGEIVRELHACGDEDGLAAYLDTIREDIAQFETELPSAWNGDGADFIGLKAEIDAAHIRCAPTPIFAAG